MSEDNREQWEKRMAVVSQAQARYLWILLLAGLFFWALFSSELSGGGNSKVTAPLIGIDLSTGVLLSSAPLVIFLLIIIIHGTLRAYGVAKENLNLKGGESEPYDLAPNAIDFAIYNAKKVSKMPNGFVHLIYPFFLSIFWGEALFLLIALINTDTPVLGLWFFIIFGALLGIIAAIMLFRFWRGRIQKIVKIIKNGSNQTIA